MIVAFFALAATASYLSLRVLIKASLKTKKNNYAQVVKSLLGKT